MPHVCAILSIFEAFLRNEAVHCGAVGPSGSSGSAGASGYVSTKSEVTGMAAAARVMPGALCWIAMPLR